MESKAIWWSKTFWANLITAAIAILSLGELRDLLGPNADRYAILAMGVLNVVMRLISSGPVTMTGAK